MLVHLQIRDFAIIDSVELELAGGLTALTGETGAGKSIIVDAVMLAIGGRSSAEMLRHGASLSEIGQLLGHRHPQTTTIYAKVDLKALRTLALPWPGGVQ